MYLTLNLVIVTCLHILKLNPYLFHLHFYSPEVSRSPHPQLQVGENCSDLFHLRQNPDF